MNNLLYISSSIIPSTYASGVHVMKMCDALNRNNINTSLVAIKGYNNINVFKFYNIENQFNIHLANIPKNKYLGPIIYNIYCFIKIITHKGDLYLRYFYPIILAFIIKKKVFIEFHNTPKNKLINILLSKLFKSSIFRGAIFITENLMNCFLSNFVINKEKCIVLPDSCDVPDVDFDDYKLNINDIGYVGSLYKGRGIEIVIELAKIFNYLTFHIVGGRNKEIEYYKNISPSNIKYYGFVDQKQLKEIYKYFSIVLAPYQSKVRNAEYGDTSKFMSPMKIFEYMAYKKAIILSDLPVLREIGEHEKHFLFVKHDCVESWKKAIIKLRNNVNLITTLMNNSHKKFLAEYTWDIRVSKLKEYYSKF